MTNHIVHFEIPVDDVKRGMTFYKMLFDWRIEEMKMPNGTSYFSIYARDAKTGFGIDGGMMLRKHASQPAMNYVHVDSIDATVKKAESMGAKLCMPKMEIAPGMGWIAAVMDPDRNMVGLHEGGPSLEAAEKQRTAQLKKALAEKGKAMKKTAKKAPAKKKK